MRKKKKIRETLLVLSPTTIPFFFVANRTPVLFTHSTLRENGRHRQLKWKSWLIKPIMLFPFPLAIFSSAANDWPRSGQWDRKEGQLRVSRKISSLLRRRHWKSWSLSILVASTSGCDAWGSCSHLKHEGSRHEGKGYDGELKREESMSSVTSLGLWSYHTYSCPTSELPVTWDNTCPC